ncbi:hypothetical protein AOQ84DRAFT_383747 [Glonium stellatum]|uniref:Uncharacterized protein n=1 Tax=Glonium stellatum TaxID=574774 RepID=A0A8E2EMZ1_9PEZI|nr:hypothetical protein AOQ84DRAFT_383747 [Glonium stellatum]
MDGRVRRKFKEPAAHDHHPDYLGDIKALSASRLVEVTTNLVRKSDDGLVLKKHRSLEYLVSILTPFESSHPHDVIHAVLSLAEDTPRFIVEPAHKDTLDSLTVIAATTTPAAGQTMELTPAAIRAVSCFKVYNYPVNYNKSFYEARRDSLEFTTKKGSRQGVRTYNASKEREGKWSFSKDAAIPSLPVRGFILDTIARTEDSAISGIIPDSCMKFGGWSSGEKSQRERFWPVATMVADRGPNGENLPTYYELACEEVLGEGVGDDDINTGQIIDRINSTILIKFTKRLLSVVWGRKLIKTASHDFLGLGPSKPEKGDFVCILYGCSVLVLLRKVEDAPYFSFIGECYIHGMVDGEAFGIKNTTINVEMFEIR